MPVQINPLLFQADAYQTGYPDKSLVMNSADFQSMLNFLDHSPAITFDFETTGVEWFKQSESCGLALAGWDPNNGSKIHNFYIPYRHQTGESQLDYYAIHPAIKQLLENDKLKIAHNLKFDLHFARKEGWNVRGPFYDTMLAARLMDENRPMALKYRAKTDLCREDANVWDDRVEGRVAAMAKTNKMNKTEYMSKYGYAQVDIPTCGTYACFDVEFTTLLYTLYETRGLSRDYPRIWGNEMQLVEVLTDMEEIGIPIDVGYLENLRETLLQRQYEIMHQLDRHLPSGMNIGSDDDIRDFLKSIGCKLSKKTKKGKFAVDKEVMTEFKHTHPAIPLISDWREAEKLVNTYTKSILNRLDANNVLHSDYQQAGTNTGRLSCKNPNFQNQPSDDDSRAVAYSGKSLEDGGVDPWSIRRAYINRGNEWVRLFYDYGQIELRVLAFYTQDPILVDAYLKGEDIHSRTSLEVFGSKEKKYRRYAKIINFGLSYGMADIGFSRQAKIPINEASSYFSVFNTRYAGIPAFKDKFYAYIRDNHCFFQNLFGRPRHLPDMRSYDAFTRGRAERQAIATLIQGTAAELTKESLVRIWKLIKTENLPAHIVATVHDEIQVDCHRDVMSHVGSRMKQLMEDFQEFRPIPIVVDGDYTITNWAEKHPIG